MALARNNVATNIGRGTGRAEKLKLAKEPQGSFQRAVILGGGAEVLNVRNIRDEGGEAIGNM